MASDSPLKRKRNSIGFVNESDVAFDATDPTLKRQKIDSQIPRSGTKALQSLKSAVGGLFGYIQEEKKQQLEEVVHVNAGPDADDGHDDASDISMDSVAQQALIDEFANDDEDADELSRAPINSDALVSKATGTRVTRQSPATSSGGGTKRLSGPVLSEQLDEDKHVPASLTKTTGRVSEENLAERSARASIDPLQQDSMISTVNSSVNGDAASDSTSRSSQRAKNKPRRFSNETAQVLRQEPKSILTPAKNKLKRPKKSVAFQVGNIPDLDLGFKDLPSPAASKTSEALKARQKTPLKQPFASIPDLEELPGSDSASNGKTNQSEVDVEGVVVAKRKRGRPKKIPIVEQVIVPAPDEEDDIKCVICNGEDSDEPNQILMCDSCDLAVHQVCYNIPIIPEGDWYCRDCSSVDDEGTTTMDIDTLPQSFLNFDALSSTGPDIDNVDYHLQIVQRLVLEKLTGRRRLKLKGLKEEFNKVHQIVEQTVLAGEGNSMLVIGSRGCGKTTLVETVIESLSEKHRQNFHIVRLNGFVHTDDKLAIREIWRQLGKEMDVDDDLTSKTSSASDTLASLLALLSHPSEVGQEDSEQTANSVVFVLDEFDLFTTHPRQTLLYNLFDIAQARKAPIAVLGLTTKIDVVESLEKRVKSRFSHRYVHLPLPKSLASYWSICRAGLSVDLHEIVEQGFDPGLAGQDEFLSYWNSMLADLYAEDVLFKQHLESHFYRSKSTSSFFASCILQIANLTPALLPLTGSSFITTLNFNPPDSKLHLLQSLAELDLALLIAAARLDIILDTDTCNFSMAYDEYSNLTAKHRIQVSSSGVVATGSSTKVWGRDVALGAWERLVDCELLIPAGFGGSSNSGGGREGRMWRVDVGLEEIPGSVEGLSGVLARWCREI